MRRKLFKVTVLLAIISLFSTLTLGGFSEATGAEVRPKLKTLRVALYSAPRTFDPVNYRDINTQNVIRLMGGGLKDDTPDTDYIYTVAESISEIKPFTARIKIRKGITFHNGDPVTADDVIFTYKRMVEPGGMEGKTSPRASLLPIDSVEKVDDYTIIAKLSEPFSVLERRWFHWEVMPKKYFEKVGLQEYLKHPIGCGPFKFVQGDLNTEIVLERYDGFYGGAAETPGKVERIPAVDRVIVKYIPEATTRVAALLAGEVDIIQQVPIDMVDMLKANPNIKVVSTGSNSMTALYLNPHIPPFNDVRVRQAVGYAINFELIVKHLFKGEAVNLNGRPLLETYRSHPAYGIFNRTPPLEYSPQKAKALLEKAGAVGVKMIIDTYGDMVEPAQVISQMLNEVGFQSSVRSWDYATIEGEVNKKNTNRVAYLRAQGNGFRTPDFVQIYVTGSPMNFFQWSNSTFEDLLKRAMAMRYNPEQEKLYLGIYKLIMEELPIINLYALNTIDAHRINVVNYYPYANRWTILHRVDLK